MHTQDGLESRTCAKCGAELEVSQVELPRFGDKPVRTLTRVEDCQVCAEAMHRAVQAEENKRNAAKWMRESRIDKHGLKLSLSVNVWSSLGLKIDEHQSHLMSFLRDWVMSTNQATYIYGAQGRSKTITALAAAVDCLRKPERVVWAPERDLIQAFRGRPGGSLIVDCQEAEVLIIDDLGRHTLDRGTAFLPELYGDLFDVRSPPFGPPLKTLITSQLAPNDLIAWSAGHKGQPDMALVGRIYAMLEGCYFEATGPDRRSFEWRQMNRRGGAR